MSFSLMPLLMAYPGMPNEAREALAGAHDATDEHGKATALERAARALVSAFGLSWSEAWDLLEPADRPQAPGACGGAA